MKTDRVVALLLLQAKFIRWNWSNLRLYDSDIM